MQEHWHGEFYCVRCQQRRPADGEVYVSEGGTRMARGTCPDCGTRVNRILGRA